jgi:hypothetical protein
MSYFEKTTSGAAAGEKAFRRNGRADAGRYRLAAPDQAFSAKPVCEPARKPAPITR